MNNGDDAYWLGVEKMSGEWTGDGHTADATEEAIDVRRLLRGISRRRDWIVVPTLLAFLLSLAVVVFVHPRYTAVAKVLLENQESYYTKPDKASGEQAAVIDPEAVQSEAEAIASTTLARKAVEKLDLAHRGEYSMWPNGLFELALSFLGLDRAQSSQTLEDRLVDAFLSHLNVFPVAKTRVLQIEFVSQDPAFAAEAANVVAQLFLQSREDAKKSEAKTASAWLAAKIDELRGKVAEADAKVETFRAHAGLLATGALTASSQQYSDINAQLANARAAQAAAQAKAETLRSLARENRLAEDPDLSRDDTLRRLAEQRITLKSQIAFEARTLLPGHPRMKELNAQLAELDQQIRLAAEQAARALENQAHEAGEQVENLTATLAAQAKTVATGDAENVELRALELDANTARAQLESYDQKYREAIARDADNAAPADARIIAPANEPRTPTFPKKIETLTLGTLAGLLLSTGVAASSALMSEGEEAAVVPRRARRRGAVAKKPALEATAEAGGEAAARPPDDDDFVTLESLADRMEQRASTAETQFALVAGVGDGLAQGAAVDLARRLAREAGAVLLDIGAVWPGVAEILHAGGEASFVGVSDVLAGEASLEAALHHDPAGRLDVIPLGEVRGPLPDGLDELLLALAETHEHVVIHASSWREEASLVVAALIHAMVVVAPAKIAASEIAEARAECGAAVEVLALRRDERAEVDRAA
jgi:polysaccharide biosynthesis transport protein